MNWFLNPATAAPTDAAQPLTGQIPSRSQQFRGAGWDRWARRDDWNLSLGYASDLSREMMDALGGLDAVRPTDPDDLREFNSSATRHRYLARRIGEMRATDTEGRFKDLPATPEEADALIMDRRRSDYEANRAMLDRGDSWVAPLAGEMGAAVAEPVSIATLPMGGSLRNPLRFILTEAALGAASEAPGVIREQQVAKDLDFTPSDPVTEIAIGAVSQAGFGAVLAGGARGIDYLRARRRGEVEARPDDIGGMDWEEGLDSAEADLRAGREPDVALTPRVGAGGISESYYAAIRSAESGGNDAARNPNSSATGRYQFTAGTWADLARKHPGLGLTPNGRLDAAQQERAIRAFTADNAAGLRSAGIPVDNGNLYAAHFLGLGDASRVLRAAPDARMTDLVSDSVISANPFLRGMSVSDFRSWTVRKAGSGGAPGGDAFTGFHAGTGVDWPTMRGIGEFDQVTTPGGMTVGVQYRVADLSDLHRASGDLQPRDRSRSASDEQIALMARNLDPRRLMPNVETTHGAPIVGPDGMVESGNGRVAALNRAADEHPENFAAYIRAIEDAGFEIPEGVNRPVLIAERTSELDFEGRRQFVRESNTSSIGRMSATEQAGVDADYLTQNAFDAFRAGRGLNSGENAEFIRRVFAAMPQAERAGLMTADGRLNIDGLRRLRQALFARAFGADDLLKLLAETEHPAVENLLRMLEDLAPDWAAFRAAVDAGYIRPEFDVTDPLMDAVRTIARARIDNREGQSVIAAVRDRLAQGDMFANRDPDMAEAIIGVFYRGERARGPDASAAILQRYIAEAETAGRADMADLLGADEALTPLSTLRRAIEDQDARAPMPERITTEALDDATEADIDLRALDDLSVDDGAHSRALTRSTDAGRRELAEQPEAGPFGPVFRDIENNPEAAIERLMAEKAGEVPVAFRHPDPRLGDIALVYGTPKFGLRHIEAKHPEMIAEIPRLLREGRVVEDSSGLPRVFMIDDADPPSVAVMRLDWDGKDKTWIVTAFTDENRGFMRASGERTKVISNSPTHANAPFLEQTVGAEPNARHLRTSNVPDASASTRIPDATGQAEDIPSTADFQGDEVQAAIAAARRALDADPDLSIRTDEGDTAQSFAVADLLDDLDQDESLIARMTSCALKGTPR